MSQPGDPLMRESGVSSDSLCQVEICAAKGHGGHSLVAPAGNNLFSFSRAPGKTLVMTTQMELEELISAVQDGGETLGHD